MTTDQGAPRHEGGPLERIHIKELVQRNTLESVVFNQKTRRIETAKKAFVRQTTRDECEMKTLLQRLQQEQITAANDDSDISSDSYDSSEHEDSGGDGRNGKKLSNPYPVTILPRFSTKAPVKAPTRTSFEINETDDAPQNPSTSRMSSVTEPVISTPRGDNKSEWLGSPSAISSVRRARKSVAEQMHTKIANRTQNDPNWCFDSGFSSPPSELASPVSHSRSNSLKERKSLTGEVSPRNAVGRRGGSLKERKNSYGSVPAANQRQIRLARSYTMLTKTALTEFDDLKAGEKIKRQNSLKEFNPKVTNESETHVVTKPRSRQNSLKDKRNRENLSDAKPVLQRTGSRKKEKQTLSRKSSNENTQQSQDGINLDDPPKNSQRKSLTEQSGVVKQYDDNLQKTTWTPYKRQAYRNTSKSLGQSAGFTPNNSPNMSPLAREGQAFKY